MTEQPCQGVRGPGRSTREDWLRAALDTLVSEGVDQVKVALLSEKLDCARSSFYWYFRNRQDLLDALLEHWANSNTRAIVDAASQPAATINFALGQLYASWIREDRFDTRLDFAIRDWARRSGSVRRAADIGDALRLDAITQMFARHGYAAREAEVRARVVYYTQIGYATLDERETWEVRLSRAPEYLLCMTGQSPTPEEVDALAGAAARMMR